MDEGSNEVSQKPSGPTCVITLSGGFAAPTAALDTVRAALRTISTMMTTMNARTSNGHSRVVSEIIGGNSIRLLPGQFGSSRRIFGAVGRAAGSAQVMT